MHPTQINTWKREAMSNMASVFGSDKSEAATDNEWQIEKLHAQIGQLKVENDFLKKSCSEATVGTHFSNFAAPLIRDKFWSDAF